MNGPGATRSGDVERLREDTWKVVRIPDQVVVLRHRQRDAVDVDLLEGILAEQRSRDVAGDCDDGHAVELRRADARHEVGGAWSRRSQADPDPARRPRVTVGRVRPTLLVPN